MEAAHEVLQEELERLRQAEHRLASDHEGRNLFTAVVDYFAFVGRRVVGGRDRWGAVPERSVHELVHAGSELVIAAGCSRGRRCGKVTVVARRKEGRTVMAQHRGH